MRQAGRTPEDDDVHVPRTRDVIPSLDRFGRSRDAVVQWPVGADGGRQRIGGVVLPVPSIAAAGVPTVSVSHRMSAVRAPALCRLVVG